MTDLQIILEARDGKKILIAYPDIKRTCKCLTNMMEIVQENGFWGFKRDDSKHRIENARSQGAIHFLSHHALERQPEIRKKYAYVVIRKLNP